MKNIVFIVSHLGAGSEALIYSMNKNSRIESRRVEGGYKDITAIESLTINPHKLGNSAAFYMDRILYNYEFSCPSLYKFCRFIYLIREARPTLNKVAGIPTLQKKSPPNIERYYRYRLRRIYEMAKHTPEAILLTWEDIASKRGLKLIEQYLNLNEPLNLTIREEIKDLVDIEMVNKAQECYERYLCRLKKLNLQYIK